MRLLFLVGPRAAGKTTVGRALARLCACPFEDTDQTVQQRAGQSVAQIVAVHGWPAFRAQESAALRAVLAAFAASEQDVSRQAPRSGANSGVSFDAGSGADSGTDSDLIPSVAVAGRCGFGAIIATGGGMVLDPANVACMRAAGIVVYLQAPAAVLAERLRQTPQAAQRPSLTGQGLLDEVRTVLQEREALYRTAAHVTIDAALPVPQVCQAVLDGVGAVSAAPGEG